MKLIYCLAVLAVVFILMYDPRSRMLERFLPGLSGIPARPVGPLNPPIPGSQLMGGDGSQCCSDTNYMANNFTQCEDAHYRGVQFANMNYGCPTRHPDAYMGAIIGS